MAAAARTPILRVRAADVADGDAVVALVEALDRERGATGSVEGAAAAVRACIGSAACDLLVAQHEGDIVGYTAVQWIPFPMLLFEPASTLNTGNRVDERTVAHPGRI